MNTKNVMDKTIKKNLEFLQSKINSIEYENYEIFNKIKEKEKVN